MPFVDSLEYLNLNSVRNYPVRDGLGMTDTTGKWTIPTSFIVEFSLAASNAVTDKFYISHVYNKVSVYVVEVSDQDGVVAGTFTVPVSGFTQYTTYDMVTAAGTYINANGRMTIGSIDQMLLSPAGTYEFGITDTEFEPKTIIPAIQGVNSLTFVDNEGNSYTLTGNVTVVARTNLRFSYDSGSNTLTLDAGNGLGLNTSCTTPVCISTINGVSPDSNGNISLLGIDCVTMASPQANQLEITDTCCTPCSGCNDLALLTSRVTQLESKFIDLNAYYNFLNTSVAQYLATVNNNNCVCS